MSLKGSQAEIGGGQEQFVGDGVEDGPQVAALG